MIALSTAPYRKSLRNETVRTFLLHVRPVLIWSPCGPAIQNKVGAFLADPRSNRILTAPEKDLRIRHIMDKGQVLLVNLAKGRIGDDSSSLLGGLLVTAIGLAAHSRADMPATQRRDFFVYIYGVPKASQHSLWQRCSPSCASTASGLHDRAPVHASAGARHPPPRLWQCRLGHLIPARDSETAPDLAREFHEKFAQADFLQVPNHRIYLKLMIDGDALGSVQCGDTRVGRVGMREKTCIDRQQPVCVSVADSVRECSATIQLP